MEREYNLIEKFADPDLMMGMSVADKLKATAVTGLMGLGVTFIVLIALMLPVRVLLQPARLLRRYMPGAPLRVYPRLPVPRF